MSDKKNTSTRKEEVRSFAFLTIVMAPVLAGVIIAAYGFIVWFYQMFAGPPHA
ncbi:MAG TPA: periplasmic nitrate reductase, NapE protein [Comamonas sp.]|uniref:periplasmic nitrate reductase, NapE protein n=1 Tax=Comamonas halotolerans TaxID=3041496 RepID=UPI0024E0F889|nr:periplasmic nitrate reductase, NapE protein [Comamonas sp. NoAH]